MRIPLLFLSVLIMFGCAGQKVREKVLAPSIVKAWPSIKADASYNAGEGTFLILNDFEEVLYANNIPQISAKWDTVKSVTILGIDKRVEDGLSVSIAVSLRRRLAKFDEAVQLLKGPQACHDKLFYPTSTKLCTNLQPCTSSLSKVTLKKSSSRWTFQPPTWKSPWASLGMRWQSKLNPMPLCSLEPLKQPRQQTAQMRFLLVPSVALCTWQC